MARDRDEVLEVARWAKGIEGVHGRIAGRFHRWEPRRRALDYLNRDCPDQTDSSNHVTL